MLTKMHRLIMGFPFFVLKVKISYGKLIVKSPTLIPHSISYCQVSHVCLLLLDQVSRCQTSAGMRGIAFVTLLATLKQLIYRSQKQNRTQPIKAIPKIKLAYERLTW